MVLDCTSASYSRSVGCIMGVYCSQCKERIAETEDSNYQEIAACTECSLTAHNRRAHFADTAVAWGKDCRQQIFAGDAAAARESAIYAAVNYRYVCNINSGHLADYDFRAYRTEDSAIIARANSTLLTVQPADAEPAENPEDITAEDCYGYTDADFADAEDILLHEYAEEDCAECEVTTAAAIAAAEDRAEDCAECEHSAYCLQDRLYVKDCRTEPADYIRSLRSHITNSSATEGN